MPNIRAALTRAGINDRMRDQGGSYDTYANLDSADIEAAALLQMGGTLDDAGKVVASQHYFSGLKLDGNETRQDFDRLLAPDSQGLADRDFDINKALQAVKSGKPAYININSNHHHAVIKICQDPGNLAQLQVRYYNPMVGEEAVEDDDAFTQRVAAMRDDPTNTELTDENIAYIVRSEMASELAEQHQGGADTKEQAKPSVTSHNIGKNFAQSLIRCLKEEKNLNVADTMIDDSKDHQHRNCCGLACADYIADKKRPAPGMTTPQREAYYKEFGNRFIEAIDQSRKMYEVEENKRIHDDLEKRITTDIDQVAQNLCTAVNLDSDKSYTGEQVLDKLRKIYLDSDLPQFDRSTTYNYNEISTFIKQSTFAQEQAIGNIQAEGILKTRGENKQIIAKDTLEKLGIKRQEDPAPRYSHEVVLSALSTLDLDAKDLKQIEATPSDKSRGQDKSYKYGDIENALKDTKFVADLAKQQEQESMRAKHSTITGKREDLMRQRGISPTPTPPVSRNRPGRNLG